MRVALMGYSRSGKDEVGKLFINNTDNMKRLAFGDGLREHFHGLFGDMPNKPREGYEKFGRVCREIQPNVWIDIAAWHVKQGGSYVITDLRQPSEAKWARSVGFKIIFVDADWEIRRERARAIGDAEFFPINESEAMIDTIEYDHKILNNWTIDEATKQVINIIQKIVGGSHQ